ncbi:MAG: hypothetical protein WAU82_13035 [Candidatus Binatus sp.]|uniref:hypothetical protein n=1 Tax=Candidatus Binatus sp. TaxID=2811406 RepID=UPI003BB1139F
MQVDKQLSGKHSGIWSLRACTNLTMLGDRSWFAPGKTAAPLPSPRRPPSQPAVSSSLGEPMAKLRNNIRNSQTEPLRRLMAAVLCEAVNRFQRDLFQTSLYRRCEFVEAEFWLFEDQSKALFSFNNVCDFLSLDSQHIRRRLCDWRRSQVRAASSIETTVKYPKRDLNGERPFPR